MNSPDADIGISQTEIDEHLEAVMTSRPFRNAGKMRRLLAYLITAVREGNEAKLKGYTIGIEALDRPDDFDPQLDPIVRVQARRLRDALEQFYALEGRDLPLRIVIGKGSYRPLLLRHGEASGGSPAISFSTAAVPGAGVPALPTKAGFSSLRARWLAPARAFPTTAAAIALITVFSVALAFTDLLGGPRQASAPGFAAMLQPIASPAPDNYNTRPLLRILAGGRQGQTAGDARFVASFLAQYSLFDLQVVRPGDHKAVNPAAQDATYFELRIDICNRCAEPGASLLVMAMPASTIIYSVRFPAANGEFRNATLPALRAIGSLDGPVLGYVRSHRTQFPRFIACLGDAYEFGSTFIKDSRERLRTCVKDYRSSQSSDPNMEQLVAFNAIVAYWHLEDASENLELALKASRRAIELDPGNARGHIIRALILGATGDSEQALAAARRGYALSPFDDIMAFGFANALIGTGEVTEARAVLDRVRRESIHVPIWILVNLALTQLLSDDFDAFARTIPEMRGSTTPLGRILQLISEARGRDALRIQTAFQELKSAYPLLVRPAIARLYLETHIRNPALAARVVSELEAAIAAFTELQARNN